MDRQYTHDQKKRLAKEIQKLRRKEDIASIFKIIYEENKSITENNSGLFMFFHTLSNPTYYKIEKYLRRIKKRRLQMNESVTSPENNNTTLSTLSVTSDTYSEQDSEKVYSSYNNDDLVAQDAISPKLKYSNKEKSLIKRKRYDKNINQDNETNVVYCKFNVGSSSGTNPDTIAHAHALNNTSLSTSTMSPEKTTDSDTVATSVSDTLAVPIPLVPAPVSTGPGPGPGLGLSEVPSTQKKQVAKKTRARVSKSVQQPQQ